MIPSELHTEYVDCHFDGDLLQIYRHYHGFIRFSSYLSLGVLLLMSAVLLFFWSLPIFLLFPQTKEMQIPWDAIFIMALFLSVMTVFISFLWRILLRNLWDCNVCYTRDHIQISRGLFHNEIFNSSCEKNTLRITHRHARGGVEILFHAMTPEGKKYFLFSTSTRISMKDTLCSISTTLSNELESYRTFFKQTQLFGDVILKNSYDYDT